MIFRDVEALRNSIFEVLNLELKPNCMYNHVPQLFQSIRTADVEPPVI